MRRPSVLVTGGAGFLGHALIDELLRDDPVLSPRHVRSLDLHTAGHPPAVEEVVADLRDADAVRRACEGVDVVIHAASLVDWGVLPDAILHDVNVQGTRNVIAGCRAASVPALVHTSSLDVVYDGRPARDIDESHALPTTYPNAYCQTKADGERAVLDASDEALRTVVLRPVGLYGERDPYHLTEVLRMASVGPLVRIGDGRAQTQHLYVRNAAHAHLVAARDLLGAGRAAGAVYFVTDSPPENFFDFVEPIVGGVGRRVLPRTLALPRAPLWALGATLEGLAWATRPLGRWRPGLSRFAVDFVTTDFVVDGSRLRDELGYAPRYSADEARANTIAWFRANPV